MAEDEMVWRTALRQGSATCRGSGQHAIATLLMDLQNELDEVEPVRDSVALVRKLRMERDLAQEMCKRVVAAVAAIHMTHDGNAAEVAMAMTATADKILAFMEEAVNGGGEPS